MQFTTLITAAIAFALVSAAPSKSGGSDDNNNNRGGGGGKASDFTPVTAVQGYLSVRDASTEKDMGYIGKSLNYLGEYQLDKGDYTSAIVASIPSNAIKNAVDIYAPTYVSFRVFAHCIAPDSNHFGSHSRTRRIPTLAPLSVHTRATTPRTLQRTASRTVSSVERILVGLPFLLLIQ